MKAIIESPISLVVMKERLPILKECSVSYYINYEYQYNSNEWVNITVIPRKITLTELDMNELFFEIFISSNIKMEYVGLGGRGCDFCINITQ